MKRSLFALASAVAAQAAIACEPPSAGAATFDGVATGTYESLYVPGQIIIPSTVGQTFTIEETNDPADCPIAGRHAAFVAAGDDLRQMSFHSTVRNATRIAFDYAKTPGTDASVIAHVSGQPTGWIALDAASGHFEFVAPDGKTVNSFEVYARHADGEGKVRIDNVVLSRTPVKE